MHGNDEVLARLRQAGKSYGKLRALDGLDLSLRAGQVTSLLGANGAGKTTAIGLLLGLLRADSGSVQLFGHDPRELAARRQIGVMLQTAGLPERLRVGELLAQARSYYPDARSIADCVALAGLDGLLDRAYGKLSGGQQQRVAIARAIVSDPTLLICDEPTGDLDRQSAEEILGLLQTLNREHGKTIVMVTHDPKAAEYATHTLHLDKGNLVESAAHA